jgi:tetratricopeptide (TPR) repeat protein
MPSRRTICSGLGALLLAAGILCGTPRLHAQEASASAREHFNRGYAFAEKGDAASAIREFERAYAISPNTSVLYNLGQAYAAAGRSREAIETLERYLTLTGPSVPEARRSQVRAQIDFHAQRVGKLSVEIHPPHATLWIDGKSLGVGSRTVRLDAGKHHLLASAPGFELASAEHEIDPVAATTLVLRLEPLPQLAELRLACPLEDVSVSVDGVFRGRTPALTSLALPGGSHQLTFQRAGYLADEHQIELAPGDTLGLPCRLAPDPKASSRARLRVRHPAGTAVFLDGARFRHSAVPAGSHQLRVEGPGYTAETRRIVLKPNETLELTLRPAHDPATRELDRQRGQSTLRTWAYIFAGVTLASGATALGIYVDTNARYERWQQRSRDRLEALPSDPNALHTLDKLLAEENDIRRHDDIALGLAIVSGAALAASTILYISSRDGEDRLVLTGSRAPELRYVRAF